MVPALTQAAEHPSLVEASHHSSPCQINTTFSSVNASFNGIKLKEFYNSNSSQVLFIKQLITNSDQSLFGLAPPASGRAEGCPVQPPLPRSCIMEERSPQLDKSNSLHSSCGLPEASKVDLNMGFHSSLASVVGSPNVNHKLTKEGHNQLMVNFDLNAPLNSQQSELLSLMGRDFNNVTEIIDTLQRIASNPELLSETSPEAVALTSVQNEQALSSQDRTTPYIIRLVHRQRQLEKRKLFLLRRLQRITARGLGGAISVQLSYLIRHGRAVLESEKLKQPQDEKEDENIGIGTLHKESMKNMSTSDLVTYVRKMEASQNLQRMNATSKKNSFRPSLPLPPELCEELDTVAGDMKASAFSHLHHDSDATESSSGGESCDEYEGYQTSLDCKDIHGRAFYKYCHRRSWVASKWSWLRSQIAYLDEKICQQEKQIKQLKPKSTARITEEFAHKVKLTMRSPAHFDVQDPALTCIATSSSLRPTINGYHPPNKVEDPTIPYSSATPFDVGIGCARSMAFKKYKKRKYIHPSLSVKRRRLSSSVVKNMFSVSSEGGKSGCCCVPPVTCILCVKQQSVKSIKVNRALSSNYIKLTIPFHKPLSNRLSKLDSAYHPTLSQPSEVLFGELLSGTLLSHDWLQRTVNSKPPHNESLTSVSNFDDLETCLKYRRDREAKRNAYRKWKENCGKERITLRLKKSLIPIDGIRDGALQDVKQENFGPQENLATKRNFNKDDTDEEYGIWQISCPPCPSPSISDKEKEDHKDKTSADPAYNPNSGGGILTTSLASNDYLNVTTSSTNELEKTSLTIETRSSSRKQGPLQKNKINSTSSSSYDIDNIVIPQSMAAATRVEHLKYKEIITPKWRVSEICPLRRPKIKIPSFQEEEEEDITDEAITIRHNRSEELEKRKFLQYIQMHSNSVRSRPRRTDSSGTSTPDNPLSPRTVEPSENSPMASPPHTPQTLVGASEDSNPPMNSTVLTLSLSSLQSSMLKSNNQSDTIKEDEEQMAILNANSSTMKPNSTVVLSDSQPICQMKRLLHRGKGLHRIIASCNSSLEEDCIEEERMSPFPSRTFPLKEKEYEDLILQTSTGTLKGKFVSSGSRDLCADNKEPTSSQHVIPINITDVLECGRDSPLSELTDSAPDEDDADERSWDSMSATPPDWTISAIQDDSGSYILQVQRN